ncbi:sugar transferase [Actinoplanes sp. TRM88002]|uniref:Sugar transferase n=1 Tax=Paractinoplanes hotanensis TaxID=2906497 RepID=A0ABT0XX36_9ACTN|nr:sugar transferase [Actinoplanes hotanensis]
MSVDRTTSGAGGSVAKRLTDLGVASVALVLAAPVLLAAAAAVAVSMGRPVWYSQVRTGRGMRPFRVYKLRTMSDRRDAHGRLLPDSERLTRVGRFLRRSSLDELPSLINVLRGDLSLVGPRPLLPRYDAWYTERERLRFTVRPGITGLAQVSGRNTLSWDDRLELDARYVDAWTYGLDLRIVARTVGRLVSGGGAVPDPTRLMADLDQERSGRG